MSYIDTIILDKTLPCLAEPGKIIVVGKPTNSLAKVIPYLATLPGVISYNPDKLTLTFRRPRGFLTIYPDKVFITQLNDSNEGIELLSALTEAINATWEGREELVALTVKRKAPRPLDIYSLLPQTNCRKCGEATCMAFACSLLAQNRALEECTPLITHADLADRLATLEALVG
jgi:ArsR family metal-binding transcriptional regulator